MSALSKARRAELRLAAKAWATGNAWPFLKAVVNRFMDDEGTVIAGYIAYAAMLAGMPFLIFTTAMAGILIGDTYSEEAVEALFNAVPEHVAQTLEPVLREVIGERRGGIAIISLLGAIWAASNGVEAIRIGLDRAYDVSKARGFVQRRFVAICFVFVGFFTFAALAVLIIFAPLIFRIIEANTPVDIPGITDLARYLVGGGMLIGFLWVCHRLLPSRNMAKIRLMPGIIVSVAIWGFLASAMSIYLAHANTYAMTYGALAGVIVTLLFFYLTAIAIIFGGEVNAVINADKLESWTDPNEE
ncbi:MAG: YihY/virulence factor BrkB family protein [Pseudomonadota bacterium]